MVNLIVLADYNDNIVAVIGHDYLSGQVFYKTTNQFVDNLLETLLTTKIYITVDDGDIEYMKEVKRLDKHYLEEVITKLELYKTKEFHEDQDGVLKDLVTNLYNEKTKKPSLL